MEHSLHLAAKHFVETVSPISSSSVRKKAAAALRLAREGGHLNMEEFDRALHSVDGDDVGEVGHWTDDDGNDDYDDDNDFTPGDALGKALALVKQVRFCFSIFVALHRAHPSYPDPYVATSANIFQVVVHTGGD
jgi:hypothetical protein